ncbi:MAG: arsenic transporter, partial [Oscillospiraceae bacterium]|nr:arsenic transporter [Oscillospiraceae bacterium]
MIPALVLFVLTYVLMLALQAWRPWIALGAAGMFLLMGYLGLYPMNLASALGAVDCNVLLMIGATM